MAASTIATLDAVLKQLYKQENYALSTYRNRPMFATISKFEGFEGRNMPIVNQYGASQGISSNFATAQSNASAMAMDDFLLTRASSYGVAEITGEAIRAAKGGVGSFIDSLTASIDSTMEAVANTIESYIPGNGKGSLGQISSGSDVTTNTITLADTALVHNFEISMVVESAATDGGSLRTGTEVVKGVKRALGQLVSTSASWDTTITAIAASDYLSRQDDGLDGGSTNKVLTGLGGWVPSVAPTAGESFFGVDRSVDSRLYGSYYDGSSVSIEEALINGESYASAMGGMVDTVFMNHVPFRRLKNEIGAKETIPINAKGPNGEVKLSFQGIHVWGTRPMQVLPCNKMPGQTAFAIESDNVCFNSAGGAPSILDADGSRILRQSAKDGYELRTGYYGNLSVKKPGNCANIKLPG